MIQAGSDLCLEYIWQMIICISRMQEEAHEIPFFVGCMVGGGEATFMAKP